MRKVMGQMLQGKPLDPGAITVTGRTPRGVKDRLAIIKKECIAEAGDDPANSGAVAAAPKKRPARSSKFLSRHFQFLRSYSTAGAATNKKAKKTKKESEDEGNDDQDESS